MITYKVSKQSLAGANTDIRAQLRDLAEISSAFKSLQDKLAVHEDAIASPTLNAYREEIERLVDTAISLTGNISDKTQKLSNVSEQAGKHLIAIEDHFNAVLQDGAKQDA